MGIFKNKRIIKDQKELINELMQERLVLKKTINDQAKTIESLLEKKEKCECKEKKTKKVTEKKPIKKVKNSETKGEVKNAKARRKQQHGNI